MLPAINSTREQSGDVNANKGEKTTTKNKKQKKVFSSERELFSCHAQKHTSACARQEEVYIYILVKSLELYNVLYQVH